MFGNANLVAVQARMERADYHAAAAFQAKVASMMRTVAEAVDLSLPTLVSFPELIGMFLSFVPRYWEELKDEASLEAAATKIVMKNAGSLPGGNRPDGRPSGRTPGLAARRLLFVDTAREAEAAYLETFSALAREHGCYIAAGSIALPPMDAEPSKGGRHIVDKSKVYNTAYLFSPRGLVLNRTSKVNLTAGLEERLFDASPAADVVTAESALGRVGTLVCFDGFHETLVERMDSLGVRVLLMPSYNQHAWEEPSTYDPEHKEGENWLRTGCPAIIQGRENIRYGVNAMLVGGVFEDMYAEGLSTIACNTGRTDACWEDGILTIASSPDAEEIIATTVELP